mmetsp:Transcript_30412/g.71025  ORF Transcript_30412/g.71025 Transcript_30412/m.71025 type:complete len:190 (+) Transcript_30412:270-839(+)
MVQDPIQQGGSGVRILRLQRGLLPAKPVDEEDEDDAEAFEEEEEEEDEELELKEREEMKGEMQRRMKESGFGHLFRSKGSMWLASNYSHAVSWSQSGLYLNLKAEKPWCAEVDEEEWGAYDEDHAARIRELVARGEHGDRRQEIVFIGSHLNKDVLKALLDDCLLTDEEFKAGPKAWAKLVDPFELRIE